MKLRQAFKICNRISTLNLVYKQNGRNIHVVGIKDVPYTFGQFRKAVRRVDKAYKRQYR